MARRSRDLPGELAGRAALDFHRHELQRQHDTVSRAWLWYIAPFMPALIWELWLAGSAPHADRLVLILIIIGAVFFWTSVWLYFSRAAARLLLQIERLNGLKAE